MTYLILILLLSACLGIVTAAGLAVLSLFLRKNSRE
jgi:hypothetical protein